MATRLQRGTTPASCVTTTPMPAQNTANIFKTLVPNPHLTPFIYGATCCRLGCNIPPSLKFFHTPPLYYMQQSRREIIFLVVIGFPAPYHLKIETLINPFQSTIEIRVNNQSSIRKFILFGGLKLTLSFHFNVWNQIVVERVRPKVILNNLHKKRCSLLLTLSTFYTAQRNT